MTDTKEDRNPDERDVSNDDGKNSPYMGLRRMVLGLRRNDFEAYMREHNVHAVLIDTNMDGIVYSVACIVDGTISLYYETGGGVLGMGQKYPDLAMATRAFVYSTDRVLSKLGVADHTLLPEADERAFYLITQDKIYKAVSRKSTISEESPEVQMLNYLSEKVMSLFLSLYNAKDVSDENIADQRNV
ncbi:MAG: hypothetical protein GXY43_03795 [Clostridiaceae bacterium]|nr:hypothetical protein [Clostridiaceae bacterium]